MHSWMRLSKLRYLDHDDDSKLWSYSYILIIIHFHLQLHEIWGRKIKFQISLQARTEKEHENCVIPRHVSTGCNREIKNNWWLHYPPRFPTDENIPKTLNLLLCGEKSLIKIPRKEALYAELFMISPWK